MLTTEAIQHRKKSDARLKKILREYLSRCRPEIKHDLEGLLDLENLRVPDKDKIAGLLWPIDAISAVVRYKHLNVAFIDYRDKETPEDGVGKTGILVRLLGIHIDYAFYRKLLVGEECMENENSHVHSDYKLVTSDIGYFGMRGNQFTTSPIVGERLLFLSDLARHIYRRVSTDYYPQIFQTDAGKEGFMKILHNLDYNLIQGPFFGEGSTLPTDLVLLLKRHRPSSKEKIVDKLLSLDESRAALYQALINPLYHCSPHWNRDRNLHSKNARNISEHCFAVPTHRVDIYPTKRNYPIHQLVETVKMIIGNHSRETQHPPS